LTSIDAGDYSRRADLLANLAVTELLVGTQADYGAQLVAKKKGIVLSCDG
jgi:hypothetical protein